MADRSYECGFIGADGKREVICHADPVPSAESGSPTGSPSQQQGLEAYLIRLIDALTDQTEALNRLASSNESLVQAMADSEGMADDDAQPGAYLNGSPVR